MTIPSPTPRKGGITVLIIPLPHTQGGGNNSVDHSLLTPREEGITVLTMPPTHLRERE